MTRRVDAPIHQLALSCYTVPTDAPEGDGTFDWHETTLALVEVSAGNRTGIGYFYTDAAAAKLIESPLAKVATG